MTVNGKLYINSIFSREETFTETGKTEQGRAVYTFQFDHHDTFTDKMTRETGYALYIPDDDQFNYWKSTAPQLHDRFHFWGA